ncbi:uncharacterized protein O3C94_000565 isoform 2-T2 [Discoglossus pictus]
MKIAITFLLLGLAGSALSLPNIGLDTKPVTNAKPGSNKSDDDLLEDVTGVMNSSTASLIRMLELVGCILEEVMDELKLDDEQKSVIRKGFETRVWTDVITTNGHSAHKIVSCLTNAVFNRVAPRPVTTGHEDDEKLRRLDVSLLD